MKHKPISDWAKEDQPRNKLFSFGPETLSDTELVAILLRNGTKGISAIELARNLLMESQFNLHELGKKSLSDLSAMKGMGLSKSAIILAATELARRRSATLPIKLKEIRSSAEAAKFMVEKLKDKSYEVFAVMYLNRGNRIKSFDILSKGGLSGTVADPRMILKRALEQEASAMILCHNHPSGNLQPSKADEEVTKKITQAAKLHDITVLDHIIVGDADYFSFADNGKL
jgi:DNA repair protein RadC